MSQFTPKKFFLLRLLKPDSFIIIRIFFRKRCRDHSPSELFINTIQPWSSIVLHNLISSNFWCTKKSSALNLKDTFAQFQFPIITQESYQKLNFLINISPLILLNSQASLLIFIADKQFQILPETHFTREELRAIYRAFKNDLPLYRDSFRDIFANIFPHGDAEHFADLVFDALGAERAAGCVSFHVCSLLILYAFLHIWISINKNALWAHHATRPSVPLSTCTFSLTITSICTRFAGMVLCNPRTPLITVVQLHFCLPANFLLLKQRTPLITVL